LRFPLDKLKCSDEHERARKRTTAASEANSAQQRFIRELGADQNRLRIRHRPTRDRVVKRVVPECAWPRFAGKQVDSQSWDAALDVVQQSLLEMAVAKRLNELADDPVLAEAFRQCERLRAKEYLKVVKTNHELAKKYVISPRTVTNWRKEGCPFEDGQWAVLDWLAGRRYAPAGANAKFGKQLSERRENAVWAGRNAELHVHVLRARRLKAAYQDNGMKPPDWLRGFRALR
jgi:hypothetical protein